MSQKAIYVRNILTNSIKKDSYHGRRRMHWHKQEKGFCKPSKLSVQVKSENYFMLNSLVYTSWLQNFYGNYSAYKPNYKNSLVFWKWFSTKFNIIPIRQEWISMYHLLSILFNVKWIVPIFLPKPFHSCWMHVRTAIGCCLSFTLMLGDLKGFQIKIMVCLDISWKR